MTRTRRPIFLRCVEAAIAALVATTAWAGAEPPAAGAWDFGRDIRPILSENCFHCHGPDANHREAGLRLDTRDGLFGDRDGAPAFKAGDPSASAVIQRIFSEDSDDVMPPPDSHRALTSGQKQALLEWTAAGAPWRRHWAFIPPKRAPLPDVADAGWPRNSIDFFILRRLEAEGLAPSPQADRHRLLRRVALDLTGVPPTPDELDAFLHDDDPNAYERAVDRLLDSPRYGERMVWDWLDAARYADSNGYQSDRDRAMWPWRDWAVAAFNDNLPFDQFTIQQLAGDLLPGATREQALATGFCRNHMINGEGGRIPEENRVDYVMDMAETTASIWLGLTFNCCRCHDHKYDALTQRDYYGLFAFFNQTPVTGGGGDPATPPVLELPSQEQTRRLEQWNRLRADAIRELESVEAAFYGSEDGGGRSETAAAAGLSDEMKAILDRAIRDRSPDQLAKLADHFEDERADYAAAARALGDIVKKRNALRARVVKVMVMADRPEPRKTYLLNRGLYNLPGDEVTAATPASLPGMREGEPMNRLGLARWLVGPENPLTARVTVNRFWQMFFGRGLTRTPGDFGAQGERPSHPQLLDRLAVEFMASGWNVKALVKQIVMSATYRQSSKVTPALLERDPGNALYARGPRYRLPSWMIRDQALFIAGLLSPRLGGPPVKPYQPAGVWADATFGKRKYVEDKGESLYRRSLYTFWRRIVGPTMFFDAAKRQTCVVKPTRTNTPMHALATLNDVTYVEAARRLAGRLLSEDDADSERLKRGFVLTVGRPPNAAESELLLKRLDSLKRRFQDDSSAADALLANGASARTPGLDPIEHAAWSALCTILLNLDEFLTQH